MDGYSPKKHDGKSNSDHPNNPPLPHHKPSSSELLKSAKLVAEAAQSHLRHEPNPKYDKKKVAGAAADLLDAAGEYGKLDDKGLGKYLDQAEDYLRKYGNPSQQQTAAAAHAGKTKPSTSSGHENKKSDHGEGGGTGEYIKMAQGLLHKKSEGGGEGGGSGGAGDFIKMAGDLFKK